MSKSALVFLGLIGGVFFIFIVNPPHTVCHSQLNELRSQHTPFFILDTSLKFREKTAYQKSLESCRNHNNPGACLKLFNAIKNLVSTLEALPGDCSNICRQKAFSEPLWETIKIMVHIGWGDQPPENVYERNKWLSYSDFSLFCRVKRLLTLCDGEDKWRMQQEKVLSSLPGADKMERKDVWKLALFATSCQRGL